MVLWCSQEKGSAALEGCVLWAEHRGWSRVFHLKDPRGAENLHRKRLSRLEELPPKHRYMLSLIRSQTMQPKVSLGSDVGT